MNAWPASITRDRRYCMVQENDGGLIEEHLLQVNFRNFMILTLMTKRCEKALQVLGAVTIGAIPGVSASMRIDAAVHSGNVYNGLE